MFNINQNPCLATFDLNALLKTGIPYLTPGQLKPGPNTLSHQNANIAPLTLEQINSHLKLSERFNENRPLPAPQSNKTETLGCNSPSKQNINVCPNPYYVERPQTHTTKQMIWVTFSREGIHRYPAALTDPKLATGDEYDVSFLGHPHRHMFNFKVSISVKHSDREIEFIQFKRWLNNFYNKGTLQLDYKSCEMIAQDLYEQINKAYPNRTIRIQVDEDGENGCDIEYTACSTL